jgi:hypothetical protein
MIHEILEALFVGAIMVLALRVLFDDGGYR